MYYVTMTDKFMSGWGKSNGKINKLVFECETYNDAEIVANNAEARGDQSYINITKTKPYYTPSKYYVQFKTKEDYPSWYEANYFHK